MAHLSEQFAALVELRAQRFFYVASFFLWRVREQETCRKEKEGASKKHGVREKTGESKNGGGEHAKLRESESKENKKI